MGASTSTTLRQPNQANFPQENNVVVNQGIVNSQYNTSNISTYPPNNYNTYGGGLGASMRYSQPKLRGDGKAVGQRTSFIKTEEYRPLTRQIIGITHQPVNLPTKGLPRPDFASQVQDHYTIRDQTSYTLKNLSTIFAKDNINIPTASGPIYNIKQYNATYQGQFIRGVPHGKGVAHFRDGGYYSGDFFQGDANGYGVYIYPNGSVYQGQFERSLFNGKGSLIYVDKRMRYDGDFVDGLPQGQGTETYSEGDRYQGQFNLGQKQGFGTYTWANGLRYEGNWQDGLMHGHGVMLNGSNVIYQGNFERGAKSGHGVFRTEKGTYEGNFSNDYLNGPGSFFWNDGRLYVGNFRNTMMEDNDAKLYYPNGQVAGGSWKNNHNKLLQTIRNDPSVESALRKYRSIHEEGLTYRSQPGNYGSKIRYGEGNVRNQQSFNSQLSSSDRGVVINRSSNIRNSPPKAYEEEYL